MDYITRFEGRIRITPPIPWGQIKDSPFLPDNARVNGMDINFEVEQTEQETDEGTMVTRHAVGLVSTWEEEARGYHIIEHVQEAIDAYPNHYFTGRLDCEGDQTADLWRLEIHDRRAVKVRPRIVWPDGTETRISG